MTVAGADARHQSPGGSRDVASKQDGLITERMANPSCIGR
jgi:hypothetical protein